MEQAIHEHNPNDYGHFLNVLQAHFDQHSGPLFTTDTPVLFDTFLAYLPAGVTRQHYNCNACRHFVNKFGSLVAIQDDGSTVPVMWPLYAPALYAPPVSACRERVARAKVTGVFLSTRRTWGKPVTGPWHHMSVQCPATYRNRVKSASQAMAEKQEDFNTLFRGLHTYPLDAVEQAITLLQSDALYRSEKVLGVAEWLRQVHEEQARVTGNRARNLLWRAAATAPVGYCHVRSTMIGTLLEDIASGMSFEQVRRRFANKMHPLQYQRPQARPTRGNIERAEKVVERLGISASLRRRYATLDDLLLLWSPKPLYARGYADGYAGVFDHIRAKEDVPVRLMSLPIATMTWVKFRDTVLPDANKIELLVPRGRQGFGALTTATDLTAPPILQWDHADNRNPVAWYVYSGGSHAQHWSLRAGSWADVTGICLNPATWQSGHKHHGAFVMLILCGAADKRNTSLALFPEILKSDLHEVRSTVEAFSKAGRLDRVNRPACGLLLRKGSSWSCRVRVSSPRTTRAYVLDRWD